MSHRAIGPDELLGEAHGLADVLPDAPYVANLCDDRYWFAVSFCAALIRGSVSLFPPNRLSSTLLGLAEAYPGLGCVTDRPLDQEVAHLPTTLVEGSGYGGGKVRMPMLDDGRVAFLAFTSGTTGQSRAHPKLWGHLTRCAKVGAQRFGFSRDTSIVATVPPQHMYGLELSIMVPLVIGACVTAARPFYPEEIQAALAQAPAPRVLVTTPMHLRTCVESGLSWPKIERIISATAPLSIHLAQRAEASLGAPVCEIYGSTETGSIASRHALSETTWRWYDGVRASQDGERVLVSGDFLAGSVPLADLLALEADGRFRLLGRSAEMVKVAGKRASLAELNQRLIEIDGVEDGLFVVPEDAPDEIGRLAAIVAAPGLDRRGLVAGLMGRIEPAFYPRRVVFVDRLPRNDLGKIPREEVMRLLKEGGGAGP